MGGDGGIGDNGHPGRDIPRLIGDERQKEQRPEPQEGQADHFPDHLVLLLACHVREDSSGYPGGFKPRRTAAREEGVRERGIRQLKPES